MIFTKVTSHSSMINSIFSNTEAKAKTAVRSFLKMPCIISLTSKTLLLTLLYFYLRQGKMSGPVIREIKPALLSNLQRIHFKYIYMNEIFFEQLAFI